MMSDRQFLEREKNRRLFLHLDKMQRHKVEPHYADTWGEKGYICPHSGLHCHFVIIQTFETENVAYYVKWWMSFLS